jgi:O-antigen/teichoic acid export membrane protein
MSGPMAEWSAGGQTLAHAQRSAAAVFAIRVAGAACAYGTQVLLARLMGKEGYGVFATTWVWILVLGHIAVFGLAQSVCSFVPAYRARNEIELARGFLAWGAAGTLGVATAMAALGALALWFAQGSINEAYVAPFWVALAVLPVFALQDYVEGVARSFNWVALAIAPPFIIRQGLIALSMAAAVVLGAPAEPWLAVACTLFATFVATAIQTTILVSGLRQELPRGARDYRHREWGLSSLAMAVVDVTVLGFGFVDVMLLGMFVPAGDVGVYFAATRLVQFVVFAQYAASAATAQRFSELRAQEDHATLRALVRRTALLTSLATAGFGGLLLLAAPWLLALFGPGFAASFDVLVILVVGAAIQSAFGPAEDLLNMLGAARLCGMISLATLVLAVLLGLVLIPRFGTVGAASAMAFAATARALALSVTARLRLGLHTHVLARRLR